MHCHFRRDYVNATTTDQMSTTEYSVESTPAWTPGSGWFCAGLMKHTTRPKAGAGRGSALLLCLSASASASANERSIWISPPSMPVIFSMMRASNQRQRFNRTVTNASSARARHTFIHY